VRGHHCKKPTNKYASDKVGRLKAEGGGIDAINFETFSRGGGGAFFLSFPFSSTRWFITAPEQQSGTFRSEIFENHFSPPRQDISVIKKHLRTSPSLTTRLVNPPPPGVI
jgi:hypothetical protein